MSSHRLRPGWPSLSLRWRLVLLVLVALLPAVLLLLQHTRAEREQLMAMAEGRALRLARVWANNHDALVREAQLMLEAARREPAVRDAVTDRCSEALRRLAAETQWSSALAVIDHTGAVLCASGSAGTIPVPTRTYVDDLFTARDLQVSEFQLDPQGRSVAFAGMRLSGGRNAQRAVIAVLELAEIQRRTAREAEGAQYNIMVIGRTGLILARDPEEAGFVGTPIGDHPLMPEIMYKTEGSAIGRGRDGVERLFAFTQLPQTGAKISVGLSRSDVVGAQERAADEQLAVLLAVAVATLGGAWLIAEFSVLRGMRALGRAADAFARGDLTQRAAVSAGAGEFATLADAFNRMAMTIEARTRALEASERRFRDIAEVAGDFFWERDAEGRYTFLSERFTEVTGIPVAAILDKGEDDIDLVAGGDDAATLRAALVRRQPFRDLVLRARLNSGEERWWRVSGNPFYDAATGAFLGFRGAGNEVTAAKRAETELRIAMEAAETANRAKSEFLATMSHELRTPLNAVIGFSEIMRNELLGPIGIQVYRDYAADIMKSGQHLLAMINDILDFAKIDAGKLHLVEDAVDLGEIARSAVRAVQLQAQAQGIAIRLIGAEAEFVVRGDERRLRQVLLNLMSNAVKFTAAGGVVDLELRRTASDEAEIVVRDTGIGISEAELPHVIEPFRQADSSHARRHEGTGLGLAICDRLVRLHGGRLSIASRLGQGTVATVTLPAERSLAA